MLRKQNKIIQNQWSDRADFPVAIGKGESSRSRPLIHSSTRTPSRKSGLIRTSIIPTNHFITNKLTLYY